MARKLYITQELHVLDSTAVLQEFSHQIIVSFPALYTLLAVWTAVDLFIFTASIIIKKTTEKSTMRLLNRHTFELETFFERPPPYAILSHRCGPVGTELTPHDVKTKAYKKSPEKHASYNKLLQICKLAEADSIDFVWMDTCCIDRDSMAELTECANSIFSWYRKAKMCYAFLHDVPHRGNTQTNLAFARSEWFLRGWTLPELIAPKEIIFFSKEWKPLGTRSELLGVVSRISKIDEHVLTGMQDLRHVSIARRMSWAADRVTTRKEDAAYCLMSLFGVSMPLLYGEGEEKAFLRLQQRIMIESFDETLFAWTRRDGSEGLHGLLAHSPRDFRDSGHYLPDNRTRDRMPVSKTGRGLCINMHLRLVEDDVWIGALECQVPPAYEESVGIYLKKLDKGEEQYARIKADRLCKIQPREFRKTVYVQQHPLIPGFESPYLDHVFQLRDAQVQIGGRTASGTLEDHGYGLLGSATPPNSQDIDPLPMSAPRWVPTGCKRTFQMCRGTVRLAGALVFRRPKGDHVIVLLGAKESFGVVFDAICFEDIAKRKSAQEFQRNKPLPNLTSSFLKEDPVLGATNMKELEAIFQPQPPGKWVDLGLEKFRIDIQPQPYAGKRYYLVDLFIEEAVSASNGHHHGRRIRNVFKSSGK